MKITNFAGGNWKFETKKQIEDFWDEYEMEHYTGKIPMPTGTTILSCQDESCSKDSNGDYQRKISPDVMVEFEDNGYVLVYEDDDGLTTDGNLIAVEGDKYLIFASESEDITNGDIYGDPIEPASFARIQLLGADFIVRCP